MSLISKILSGAIAFTAALSQIQTNGSASDISLQTTQADVAQELSPGYIERSGSVNAGSRPKRELYQSVSRSSEYQAHCVIRL